MRMLLGRHQGGIVPHRDTWDSNNILRCGQIIDAKIDKSWAVWMTLRPGEASLDHVDM
jgi:hypothetical protein